MILTHLFESLNEARLNVGDPIIVTGPNEFEGKTGEIAEFSPSGKFVVVNLYNHGEHSMHLSDVEYNQYADDQADEDDWYDDGAEDTLEGATDHAKQIHDLNFDMLALLDAAKTASPEQKAILKQKFQIAKQKRNELLGGTLADSPKGDLGEGAQDLTPYEAGHADGLSNEPYENPYPDGSTGYVEFRKGYRAGYAESDLDEGFQDFNRVEPYAVCLAGKPVKKFDYYEQARKFHDNWKQKLYREGDKAKADTITLMPLNLDEAINKNDLLGKVAKDLNTQFKKAKAGKLKASGDFTKGDHWQGAKPGDYGYTGYQGHGMPKDNPKKKKGVAEGGYDDPKIQFLQPTIQFAEKMGYKATLNPQGRVVAKLVNKQLGHIVHIGLMQPSGKGFEVSMADNLDKQTNAWSAKELAQDFKGWYAQAVKDQDFNNGYNEKPQLEQQGVAEDTDSWFRVTVKTPNGKNHNIQVPANSHGTAKRKALAYCAKNSIAGAEFVSAMRMPTLDEQGVAEGDELTHAGQDVMVWTGPPTNNPPRDDKKYWVRGQLDSTEMHGGSMRANVMTTKGMYNPELSRVFNADMSEAYTPSPAKPFRNPPGFNKQGTGLGNKLAQQTRDELAKKKQQGVAEGHADQQRKIFKKNGEPVGEVGIDRESSPGNGQWYMKHYASDKDLAGYDSYEEALAELKHCMKQGVAEEQKPADPNEFRPVGPITIVPPKKLKSGETYQDRNKYWQSQGQAPIYKTNEEGKGTPVPAKEFARGVLKDLKKVNVKEAEGDFRAIIRKVMSKVHVDGGGGNLSYVISQQAPTMDMLRDVYHDDIERMLAKAHPNELKKAAEELKAMFKKDVAEAETDYSKRRQRERDVDAGKPVAKQRPSKMTDYQKRRAQQKKEMELGETKSLAKRVKVVAGDHAGKTGTVRQIKTGAFKGAPKTYYIDLDDGGQADNLPGKALRLVRDTAVEGTEKTATGLRHRAEPGVYGGAEPEEDPLRTLDKSGTNKIEKSLGIKFDREKKYQGGIDLGDGELDEVSKATLGRYVKLAGIDTADRSSSSSYKSGAAGDKYNKADPSRQEQNRERGIDRAVTRLTK